MKCNACAAPLSVKLIDLGAAPPSNAFNASQDCPETHYPLRVFVCMACGLAQTDIGMFKLNHDQLFAQDYPYFSSTSSDWIEHARVFVEQISADLCLGPKSLTVEIGCNDGYLLQFMKTPCYGFEPTATGKIAEERGVRVYRSFFDQQMALRAVEWSDSQGKADLMICNNVLAHVPDINNFVRGFSILLKDTGVATFEFPHLLNLIDECQFDTIYHEHYSYLSLAAVVNVFKTNGLDVFDVENLPTHGGSLRVYAQKTGGARQITAQVPKVLLQERSLSYPQTYARFQERADRIKNDLLGFLIDARARGRKVVGFGAAAKANTLLNYAGIRADLIEYVVDDTPAKQGKFMPGSRIPVRASFGERPDYIVVFPHNWRAEITARLSPMRAAGVKLVFAIPQLEVMPLAMLACA